jgi:hypothetical protein
MRSYFMPAIAIAMIMPATARSDDIPNLDVRPICRGIASQSADPLSVGLTATFEECMRSEQDVREQLKKEWSTFSAADKRHCVALATTGGESSNTEFVTCLEMARDVRALRSAEAASSSGTDRPLRDGRKGDRQGATGPAATRAPSSPSRPTVQPASANTASRPASEPTTSPPASEPTTDADSTLKELQRVKADALNARASEVLTQRKLANAEADLKRAQEEAGRATKEAEQAKADAKAAREAKVEAERKLADAESARTAAEESAAKSEPGLITWLPSWLRSWFGW